MSGHNKTAALTPRGCGLDQAWYMSEVVAPEPGLGKEAN
jgi:hypothetical protein